ncbi:tetratricopeptide repeat protein 24 [Chanodichthys erythropterus]|uniref:tetratricopeptide repeat protein 24 n=1 Tax=Chanodichthys erythropterus TaxID=933992 RepID=UPI00351ED564
MASDGSPVRDAREKQKRKKADRSRSDVEETDAQVEIERLTAAGHAALQTGDNTAALRSFRSALKAATKLREKRLQRTCALNLGAAYVEAGEPQKGLDVLSRAQPGERGERIADLQFNLATAHEALGEQTQAAHRYLQAAQLYRSQGDAAAEGDTCVRLARCHLQRKEWDEAAASFRRAAESYKTAGNTPAAALALKDAGKHMLQSGRNATDDIISVLTDSLEMSANISDQETLGKLLNDVGLSFSQMRLFSEASECYEQALPLVASKPHRLAVVLQNLGAVHNTLGQYQQAVRFHREAAALHGSLGSRGAQGRCFSNLGFALVEMDELEEAWESYIHAQQAFRDTDDASGQWQACEGLGGIKLQMRDPEKAAVYYKDALRLLCKCQDVSSSVQERLVSKLSEALQQKLLLQQSQRGAATHRTVPERHHNRRLPRSTAVRSEVQQWRKEMPNGAVDGENPATDGKRHNESIVSSESRPRQEQEQADHHNALPEANRNLNNTYDKAELHQQNFPSESSGHGDLSAESMKPRPVQMNGTHPLVRSTVTPPLTQHDNDEATPLTRRLKSRFCTVM